MPCEGMSFEQGKHTNWTAAGEEQQLVKIHTKQGGGWVKNKSQISWTTALPFLYQADPKNGIDRARRTQTTQRWAGFESPWPRKSCFNNPNPYPRAPKGLYHLCYIFALSPLGKRSFPYPSWLNPRCAPPAMEGTPSKLTEQDRDRKRESKERNASKYEKLIAN